MVGLTSSFHRLAHTSILQEIKYNLIDAKVLGKTTGGFNSKAT